MNKTLHSEKGITLVELLATIAVSGIVIILISNVMITAFSRQDQSQSHLDLRQEANLIVTKLREVHNKESFELCYLDQQLMLNGKQLARDSLFIEHLVIIGSTNNEEPFTLSEQGECFTIKPKDPLSVHFTLNDKNNNQFELETVMHRFKGNSQLTITVPLQSINDPEE